MYEPTSIPCGVQEFSRDHSLDNFFQCKCKIASPHFGHTLPPNIMILINLILINMILINLNPHYMRML